MRTQVCPHCGKQVRRYKKLKHLQQHYCGAKACQSARKLRFGRQKYKTNSSFLSDKLQGARDRKKAHADRGDPLTCSHYQRDYRASHPDYVKDNRQKQRARNARRAGKTMHEKKIVNPDAFVLQKPVSETVYAMIAMDYQNIANPNTLMSQISDIKLFMKDQPMFVRLL